MKVHFFLWLLIMKSQRFYKCGNNHSFRIHNVLYGINQCNKEKKKETQETCNVLD